MTHPPPRIPDDVVLSRFRVDPTALVGGGGEAAVYAIDADRVLRLPRTDVAESALDARQRWMAAYWTAAVDDVHLQQWCDRILGGRP